MKTDVYFTYYPERRMNNAKLIVALDLPASSEIPPLLTRLPAEIEWFKVGLELFTSEGPAALAALKAKQKNIFLDLKLHDIPNTVARAVRSAAAHHVSLLTVHALGGETMLKAAVEAAKTSGEISPEIIAVTILTSHSQEELTVIGIQQKISDQVLWLAELALKCGVDGLVASVEEAALLRRRFGNSFTLVVPGIRPAGSAIQDQKRIATPATAILSGADFLVVGRPILEAKDPGAAARAILTEMADGDQKSEVKS